MNKNKIYTVFILIFITFSYNVLAQSKFEIDTARAIRYVEKIKSHERIRDDTFAIYLDSIRLLKQNTKSSLVKGIYQYSQGYICFSNNDFDSAIIYLEESKNLIYGKINTSFYLKLLDLYALSYLNKLEPDSAIKILNQSISILSNWSNYELLARDYYHLSNAYSQKYDFGNKLKYLLMTDSIYKVNNITKYDAYLYNSMAILYNKSGKLEKSKALYLEAISIAKNLSDTNLLASIYINLGDLYSRGYSNYDSAAYYLKECINISAQNGLFSNIPKAEVNLSNVYYGQKKYKECINILRRNLNSDNTAVKSSAWINTGLAFYNLNSDSAKFC